jgi:RNA polymerase sigma-70 factor (ECF subfamily)
MTSSQSPEDLTALVHRARDGDEAALMQLLHHYEPRLRTAAHVLLGPLLRPSVDSVDLVQSVHRVLLPGLREGKYSFSDPERLIGLALTIIRRKVARNWRQRQREPRIKTLEFETGPTGELPIPSRDPLDDPAVAVQINDAIHHLLASLSEEDRRLVELRLEGHSNVEIAALLGCEPHPLRARLSRLRRRLREQGWGEWI